MPLAPQARSVLRSSRCFQQQGYRELILAAGADHFLPAAGCCGDAVRSWAEALAPGTFCAIALDTPACRGLHMSVRRVFLVGYHITCTEGMPACAPLYCADEPP